VKNPKQNVKWGIFLGLGLSILLYVLVSFVAVGLVGAQALGGSDSPLSLAAFSTGVGFATGVLAIGALAATFSVLLGDILGLSRMIFAMGRRGDYPKWCGEVDKGCSAPRHAVLLAGIAIAVPTLLFDLRNMAQVASFLILSYFMLMNLSALRIPKARTRSKILSGLALAITVVLAFSLQLRSVAIGLGIILAGACYHILRKKKRIF
jgi:APA family basic amino acid/polyamine antiporter